MEEHESKKNIPIEWYVPEDITSRYSNNIVVQHTDSEFIVSFFETIPPALIGSPENIKAQLDNVEKIRSKCVARIIISPGKMKAFIQALNGNLEKFLSRKESVAKE